MLSFVLFVCFFEMDSQKERNEMVMRSMNNFKRVLFYCYVLGK